MADEQYVEIVSATVVCSACGFVAQIDGGETEAELQEVCLQIEKLHGRQRHGEVTSFQTTFQTYEQPAAPIDASGRPRLVN